MIKALKISDVRHSDIVRFGDIEACTVFQEKQNIYIKVRYSAESEWNAVDLRTGDVKKFTQERTIHPLKSELIISE